MTLHEILLARAFGGGGGGKLICELTTPKRGNTLNDMKSVSISYPNAESVGDDAFYNCGSLKSIDLPVATSVGEGAFNNCTALTSIDLPAATSIGLSAFNGCSALRSVNLPVAASIGNAAFYGCTALTSVDLPAAESVDQGAFYGCTSLDTVILRKSDAICQFIISAFVNTKITTAEGMPTGEGFIYVHSALYENYVSLIVTQATAGFGLDEATATYIATAILRKIEDYPEICG